MIDGINQSTEVIIGVCTAAVMLAGAYKVLWYGKRHPYKPGWVKGFLLDMRGFRDAILGREEQRDSITREVVQPALPGIGVRMANQENQMSEMTRAVTQLAETHMQMAEVRAEVKDLAGRVDQLEVASVERALSKVESIAAYEAIAKAHDSQPDHIDVEAEES